MGELTVVVCSLASVVLVAMVLLVAVVASWERPAARGAECRDAGRRAQTDMRRMG